LVRAKSTPFYQCAGPSPFFGGFPSVLQGRRPEPSSPAPLGPPHNSHEPAGPILRLVLARPPGFGQAPNPLREALAPIRMPVPPSRRRDSWVLDVGPISALAALLPPYPRAARPEGRRSMAAVLPPAELEHPQNLLLARRAHGAGATLLTRENKTGRSANRERGTPLPACARPGRPAEKLLATLPPAIGPRGAGGAFQAVAA